MKRVIGNTTIEQGKGETRGGGGKKMSRGSAVEASAAPPPLSTPRFGPPSTTRQGSRQQNIPPLHLDEFGGHPHTLPSARKRGTRPLTEIQRPPPLSVAWKLAQSVGKGGKEERRGGGPIARSGSQRDSNGHDPPPIRALLGGCE